MEQAVQYENKAIKVAAAIAGVAKATQSVSAAQEHSSASLGAVQQAAAALRSLNVEAPTSGGPHHVHEPHDQQSQPHQSKQAQLESLALGAPGALKFTFPLRERNLKKLVVLLILCLFSSSLLVFGMLAGLVQLLQVMKSALMLRSFSNARCTLFEGLCVVCWPCAGSRYDMSVTGGPWDRGVGRGGEREPKGSEAEGEYHVGCAQQRDGGPGDQRRSPQGSCTFPRETFLPHLDFTRAFRGPRSWAQGAGSRSPIPSSHASYSHL